MEGCAWWRLIPDTKHELVIGGHGQWKQANFVAASLTDEGTGAIVYAPTGGTIQVDMGRLRGPVTGIWFDPTSGQFKSVEGSPFRNEGKRDLTPIASNAAGEPDWVLVLARNVVY